MSDQERLQDFIFLLIFFAGGLVLISLFFQAMIRVPFLSNLTWGV